MSVWIPIVVDAVTTAIHLARERGLPAPAADEIAHIRKELDDAAARLLPLELAGLAAYAQAAAARIEATIATLPTVERCPNDGNVLTIHNGPAGRHVVCDKCGFRR